MDQTDSTTSSSTNERSQPSEPKDVFLSHSGKQKNFVRQLYTDLTNQGLSCFFDQDRESLPVAENFPSRIFEAAKTCKVAVLLLSKDFLESKWPMLELSAFVEARDISCSKPNLKILPLFFLISPDALKNTEENDRKWKQLEISREKRAEWHRALHAVRRINGLPFGEGGDEVKFRDEIVKEIWHILPTPSPRYHVHGMQGEARMCQEVANFFYKVQPQKRGIRIVGLYGIAGHGKTTLGKAFCNFKLGEFGGKVCHLEFSRGDPFERTKLALQYLTHRSQSYMQTFTNQDQAKVELYRRVEGKRVLLVLDNITEDCIEEVVYYLKADIGKNSWILLSARSGDVLAKYFQLDKQSCMHVPRLQEEEAITILLERAFPVESTLRVEDTGFALKCAKRCLFKEVSCDNIPRAQTFHPLALKAFGGYLFSKYGSNLSKWAAEIDGTVDRAGDGLDEVFAVLGKAFDDMPAKYRTIFMLLTVYMLPNMSLDKVIEWMAINCNEKISFIEKAVQDLRKKAFIEESEPEIRIHDLYFEFAQNKADKMEKWLWWKDVGRYDPRGLISEDKEGFELAKLEQCTYETIEPEYVGNLFVLQLVHVQNMSTVDLGPMNKLRSITLRDCKVLEALDGTENLRDLAWLQIIRVNTMFKLPDLSRLKRLQHLEIDIAGSLVLDQLGDLTHCSRLREVSVVCPSLLEFPRLKGMKHLEKVEFSLCDEVKGPLDCRDCLKLQTIVLSHCCQMTVSPLLNGCKNLSKLILSKCDAVTVSPVVDAPSTLKTLELFISSKAASVPRNLESFCELKNLQLWNMRKLMKLPSFKRLSNLTVLELVKCGIRQPPDLTGCDSLEDVYFFQLENLVRFPSFSSVRELKKLSLCNCTSVQDPPDIEGCHKLQVFHLLYNDYMKGLPEMNKCAQLEEIQVSWHSAGEVQYREFNPYSCPADDDLEFCLEHFKDEKFGNIGNVSKPEALKQWQWLKGKRLLVKRYFRGLKLYYSLTAPYENGPLKDCKKSKIILAKMNGKVTLSPTMAKDSQDRWLKKVEEYFAASAIVTSKRVKGYFAVKDIGSAIVASKKVEEYFTVEDIVPTLVTSKKLEGCFAMKDISPTNVTTDPLPLRYPVPPLQGEGRMCQEVAVFLNKVSPNEKGIRIAGLYGMSGQGKTMLAKAFCNRSLRNFDGKVCYLEFCGFNKLKRLKHVLHYLTELPMPRIGSVTNEDEARGFFNTLVKGKNVFLVLDNISEESIDEVTYYLQAELGENSCILLIARSVDLLVKHFNIDSQSCMPVPRLEEEEAIAILWERKPSVVSGFPAESRDSALKCAEKCSFKRDTGSAAFHPLASKVFSRQLFLEQSTHFSIWAASCHPLDMGGDVSNNVFDMLHKAFASFEDKRRSIFIHLARHKPPNMSTTQVFHWLAKTCNNEISYIEEAVKDLFESAFIEEMEPEIRIHELMKEFAQMTNKDEYDKLDKIVISSLLEPPSQRYHVPAIQGGTRMCQKVSDLFNAVLPNRKKIRIAGLYGLPGQGKTTLCKTFCNLNLKNFDGRVCHLEFCGGNKLDRQKLALEYLTHCSESQLESLTREDEAQKKLYKNVRGHRVLLVLDNITEDSIDEVKYYLDAKLGENSCVLLSTRSEDVLKKLNVNLKSRMSVPGLQEEEAIAILLEKVFPGEPTLEAEDRGFALKCAEICLFKETCCDNVPRAPTFHPLALKAFGRYLFSKYRSDLSKWAAEIDGMEDRADDGLKDMFIVLDKAFDCMCPINRAIFMLLTLYMLPSISPLNVHEWLAITCKKNIESIEEAVGDLRKKSFIEETEPEIRIHNVYMEFALSRARKLKRWLWFEGNLVTSEAKGELELADVEYNQHLDLSKIEISAECGLKNLWALEVVNENKEMSNLGISLMKCIRSFPSQISEYLAVLRGMENLPYLASLQVGKLPDLKTLNLRRLHALQYLEIAIGDSSWPTELGDLTVCVSLREIYVCCRSLSKFPLIHGLECLEKANFKGCDEVFGQLDCSGCVKLRSVVFEHCSQMAYIPLIADCSNLSKIVLNRCDPITEYSDENESYGLEISELCISSEDASAPRHSECCDGFKNLPLWNIVISSDVPSLRRLSNLTVLKLYKCDISEPPDVTYCSMLEDVYFSRLRCLQRFPNFSSLGKLKKLCLCNCTGVQYPPAIKGCQGLQVFHLIYNDNMESLPQMNGFPILEEIKLSWQLEEENRESCSDEDEELDDSHDDLDDSHDNLEICPNYQQDEIFRNLNDVFMPEELKKWQWIQDKTVRVKKYSRGLKKYYCMTAPYGGSGAREEASNGNTLEQFTIPTASTICG